MLLDTKGPEIRTGELPGHGKVTVKSDGEFTLFFEKKEGDEHGVYIDYPKLANEVKKGQNIFIDDGAIHLEVVKTSPEEIKCRVIVGGELGEHKGVNVPGADLSVPTLTEKDIADLKWGAENNVDYVAVSFVRSKEDIIEVRRVLEAGRRCSLTTSVLEEWARLGTPKQVEYLAGYLEAERDSRDASRRAQLLRRCGLPAPKTFDGYDWSAVSWPGGLGREDLLSLSFLERREDLVLMGDVGTGKTHMASALCQLACDRRLEARFFTASSLVMRLRRARDEGRLDREMSQIGRAALLVIDELGFLPLDADGARLVFQVFADAYERQSVVITTNLEFSRWGSVFGDDQMAAAVIDRIVHHGRLVQFKGESYRVRHALM